MTKQEQIPPDAANDNRNRDRQILNMTQQEQIPPGTEYPKTRTDTARY
jgi:hypothetical protein